MNTERLFTMSHRLHRTRTSSRKLFSYHHHSISATNLYSSVLCLIFMILIFQPNWNNNGVVTGIYVEQYLNSPDVCSPASGINNKFAVLAMEQVHLGNFPNHTAIMKLSRWQEKHSPTAFVNFRCRFEVVAPRDHGVMVTIREMNFRRFGNSVCQDFLKFKPEGRDLSQPVCGEVSSDDKSIKPSSLEGKRLHYDPKGALDVIINTGDYLPGQNKPILLEMVLTAYSKKCGATNPLYVAAQECAPNVCIASSLFCDGVVNCGYENNYGVDEQGCPDLPSQGLSRGMGFLIFILSAIGTLLAVGVIVFTICCCCDSCTKKRPRSSRRRRRGTTASATQDQSTDSSEQVLDLNQTGTLVPSAPPVYVDETNVEHVVRPNAPKLEDLPPSYIELFPEQIVIAKT